MSKAQIVIGIPGKWKTRTELIVEVATKSDGYLMAGNIIHNASKSIGFEVEVYDHDPNLKNAFAYAGRENFEDDLLSEIDQHTFTVYVIAEVNGFEGVRGVIEVGAALLMAGGLAVKIESSGIAHTKDNWNQLAENMDYFPAYSHFITLIGDEEMYYSCGMKTFGFPDTVVPSSFSPEEAAEFINGFNLYQLVEHPTVKSGHAFSLEENSPIFTIHCSTDTRYDEDDVFHNPYGLVHLTAK